MKRGLCVFSALAIAPNVFAHHSDVAFDMEAVTAFRAEIVEYNWRNPHVYFRVVTSVTGQPVEWLIQSNPTMMLARSGWSEDTFQPGETVTVRGHPERDPEKKSAILMDITKEDGTVFSRILGRDSEETARATSLNGKWKARASELGPLFNALDSIPPTEKGAAAMAAYDIFEDEYLKSCVGLATPIAFAMGAVLYVSEVELGDEIVYFRFEGYDLERPVYMDGRGHPEDVEPTIQGHSIGWWEDDTLVIDTANFAYHPSAYQNGIPSGEQKHVIERYRLKDDGSGVIVEVFLEDPEYLSETFSATFEWQYTPNTEMYRYDCQPDVSSQFAF